MELYILDSALRRTKVIDRFESLIWTERFSSFGDFELVIHSTIESRSMLPAGTLLAINLSWRVMIVETIENKSDADGRAMLSITGRSLESILLDRVAKSTMSDLTTDPYWELLGTPGDIARHVFTSICVEGDLSVGDIIPYIQPGTFFPPDTIVEPADEITVALEIDTVYATIKSICDAYDLGFRLVRALDLSELYFNVYSGNDRTTSQTVLPPVVFSPELDNLEDVSELTSIAQYKNVAVVFAPNGVVTVYAAGADASTSGFARRVIYVDASDVTLAAPAALTAELTLRGQQALSENTSLSAFDGEIPQFGSYRYGVDYDLGDLVEVRNSDGITNNMRVTEQIFVSDSQGERSYPTLAIKLLITPGSWLAWESNNVWDDELGTWEDA